MALFVPVIGPEVVASGLHSVSPHADAALTITATFAPAGNCPPAILICPMPPTMDGVVVSTGGASGIRRRSCMIMSPTRLMLVFPVAPVAPLVLPAPAVPLDLADPSLRLLQLAPVAPAHPPDPLALPHRHRESQLSGWRR